MFVYQIKLPKKQDAKAFATFMSEEYFPAIHKGPTRVGQVTDLTLLQGDTEELSHDFFWLVGWGGLDSGDPHIDNPGVLKKLKGFGARIKRLGVYNEVAKWSEK